MKIFQKSIWSLLTVFFGIMLIVTIVGGLIAAQYSTQINGLLDINPFDIVDNSDNDDDTEYYKSASGFYKSDGSYDNTAMRANSMKVSLQAAEESGVLLWNDHNALPLSKDENVNLFGVSSVNYLLCEQGSGYIAPLVTDTLKSQLEENGVNVNTKLFNAYKMLKSKGFVRSMIRTEGMDTVNDACYNEMSVKEASWNDINSTTLGNVTDSLSSDAAIMTVTRVSGEDLDSYRFVTEEFKKEKCFDDNYMDLSAAEADVLSHLQALKTAGKLKKIILLINCSNAVQFKNIKNYGVDACVWAGVAGNVAYDQVARLLTGKANPSGHLSDTYVYDAFSAPATENFGDFTFTVKGAGVPADANYTHNDKYIVYREGIYVGYRYYETRYEDSVIGGRNADGTKGVKAGSGGWDYNDEVAFPFGHGESYTTFAHSGYTVIKDGENYKVTMTVENTGKTHAGKDVMQVYLQKPYTDYDKEAGIEKAAVESVGFAKTDLLEPGDKQTLTVTVEGEDFKSYDAYGKKTYILEEGKYYIAAGRDAHDALNNILAKKGYDTGDGMDASGNAGFAEEINIAENDYVKYAVSSDTGKAITNQFDNADINLYDGTTGQRIEYLSRKDWQGTYPSAVKLACSTPTMVADMRYGETIDVPDGAEMPVFGKVGEKYGKLTLCMLTEQPYGNEYWQALLDQLTWEDANCLISGPNDGAVSVAAPGMKTKDGPFGVGLTADGLDSCMCFPCEVNLAATWNADLVNEIGYAFGLEVLHLDYTGLYGPGANIHRSASFSGRNAEYFSEDGFLSGKMLAAECAGLQKSGVIVYTKHFLLNDLERNRYGVTVWANEQSVREIYLKAFEAGVTEGKMNGIMTSFNRIGCTWSGRHKGLLTEVLRNEWGFVGACITDAAVCTYFHQDDAHGSALVAGQDIWMGGSVGNFLEEYKDNAVVCQAVREACQRILYARLHSNAMNGVGVDSKIVRVTTWWETAIRGAQIGVGIVCGICVVMTVLSFVFAKKRKYDN